MLLPSIYCSCAVTACLCACVVRVEAYYTEGVDLVHQSSELQVHRLVVELEMGGNVRFEDGTLDDIW